MPSDVHRTLKSRAAASGRSLSEYVLDILSREARKPTLDELLERAGAREPVEVGDRAVSLLRADRDASR